MNFAAWVWLGIAAAFLFLEACTVTLVSVWFAAGSLCAMTASVLRCPPWVQLLVFLAVSAGMLAMLMPFARKHINPKITRTNVDSLIGRICPVTAAIDNLQALGQVKVGAMTWTARSTNGAPIAEGTAVRIDRVEGVKLFVSPVKEAVKQ